MFKRLRRFIPPLAYIDILHEALADEMQAALDACERADEANASNDAIRLAMDDEQQKYLFIKGSRNRLLSDYDDLVKENERLSGLLDDPELLAIEFKSTIEGHLADVTMKHWASKLLASSFADSFNDAGATNFVELSLGDDEYGHWIVTVQKRDKKSPGDMMAELKELITEMRNQLESFTQYNSNLSCPFTFGLIEKADAILHPTPNKD